MSNETDQSLFLESLLFAVVFVAIILLSTFGFQTSYVNNKFAIVTTILWSQLSLHLLFGVAAILVKLLYFKKQERQTRPLIDTVRSFLIFSGFLVVYYAFQYSRSNSSIGFVLGYLWYLTYGLEFYVIIFGTALISLSLKNPFYNVDGLSVFIRGLFFMITGSVSIYFISANLSMSLTNGVTTGSSFFLVSLIIHMIGLLLLFLVYIYWPRYFFKQEVSQVIRGPNNQLMLFLAFVFAQSLISFLNFYFLFSQPFQPYVFNFVEMLWFVILGIILRMLVAGYTSLCWFILIQSYYTQQHHDYSDKNY